jgi:hypothetical protein
MRARVISGSGTGIVDVEHTGTKRPGGLGRQSVGNEWILGSLGLGGLGIDECLISCPVGSSCVPDENGGHCVSLSDSQFIPAWAPWALLGVVAGSVLGLYFLTRGGQ